MSTMISPPSVRSKIVCTIGPASNGQETLMAMKEAGMDVARLNLSHGSAAEHRRVFKQLRQIEDLAVLVDLPGPKIRLGELESNYVLEEGDEVHFTTESIIGNRGEFSVSYSKLPGEVKEGGHLFINDGLIDMLVTSIDKDLKGFNVRVISGGEVSSRKGVNAPGAALSIRPPTVKDIDGIKLGIELDADWMAISFVRSAGDVDRVKERIFNEGGDQPVISKIEHREAIDNIDEIIEASDGVMVARGDLGIEIPPWEVPLLQKQIISKCNRAGKPVIVATQMLESMMQNPRPTRAEASDVANAVLDGADAVMLSGETAIGKYPVEAVRAMNSISMVVQSDIENAADSGIVRGVPVTDVIGNLVTRAVDAVDASAILVVTRSGVSARMVSKHRPRSRILAVARDSRVRRRMILYWGVEPLNVPWTEDRDSLILRSVKNCVQRGFLKPDDVVSVVSGSTLIAPGRTTTLEILEVEDILRFASRRD